MARNRSIAQAEPEVVQPEVEAVVPPAPETVAPEVTVLEPGLANGLTAHEVENAHNAMGINPAVGMAALVAAAAAAAAEKPKAVVVTGAAGKTYQKPNRSGKFAPLATHEGWYLRAVGTERRKAGREGYAGDSWLALCALPVKYEDMVEYLKAIKLPGDFKHVNWDINRGWVELVPAEVAEAEYKALADKVAETAEA